MLSAAAALPFYLMELRKVGAEHENSCFGTDGDSKNPHITRHSPLGNSKKRFYAGSAEQLNSEVVMNLRDFLSCAGIATAALFSELSVLVLLVVRY